MASNTALAQVRENCRLPVRGRLSIGCLYDRNLSKIFRASRKYLLGLQMRNEWIESCVLRNDMTVRIRLCDGELPNVEGNMKIQRIGTTPSHLHVRPLGPSPLQRRGNFITDLGLLLANKNHDFEAFLLKHSDRGRLNALIVDKNVVGSHAASSCRF